MIKNFIWLLSGKTFANILQVIFTIISARLLSPDLFGIYASITIIVSMSIILIELGTVQAIIQSNNISLNNLAWNNLFTIFLAILLGISIIILVYLFNSENKNFYSLSSIILFFYSLGITSQANLLKLGKFKEIALIETSSYFFSYLILGITLILLDMGIVSLIISQLVDTIVKSFSYITLDNQKKYFKTKPIHNQEITKFGLKFSLIRIVNQFTLKSGQTLLTLVAPQTNLGFYNRAEALSFIPVSLIGHTLNTLLISHLSNDNTPNTHNRVTNQALELIISLIIPITIILIIYTRTIIFIIFGEKWLDMTLIFQILITSLPFRIFSKIAESQLTALGFLGHFFRLQVYYLVLSITLIIIGFFAYKITGVALGATLSAIIYSIMLIYQNKFKNINTRKINKALIILFFSIICIILPIIIGKNNLIYNIEITIIFTVILLFIQFNYHKNIKK